MSHTGSQGGSHPYRQNGSTVLAATSTPQTLTDQATHGDNYAARCEGVQLRMDSGNAGSITVGYNSNLTEGTNRQRDGIPIAAGEDYFVPCSNPSLVYLSGAADDKVYWMAV